MRIGLRNVCIRHIYRQTVRDYATVLEHDGALAQRCDLRHRVRYQDKRAPALFELLHLVKALSLKGEIADGENFEGCSLARSIRADDADRLTGLDPKRHVFERPELLDCLVLLIAGERIEPAQRPRKAILHVPRPLVTENVPLRDVLEHNGRL